MKEEQFLDNSEGLSKADASLNEERLSIVGKIISLLISFTGFVLYFYFRLDPKNPKAARDAITFLL